MLKPGVYPAAVTPMKTGGETIDTESLARLLATFETAGCAGAVLAGTNGEGPSLGFREKVELLKAARESSQFDLVMGVATPSWTDAADLCEAAAEGGAVAALVMPPGYFRDVSEDGLAAWFNFVLDRSPLPVLVYNFPKRTGVTLSPGLLGRLAGHPKCAGAKDSSGNADNLVSYAAAMAGKLLYVGDETLLLKALHAGWSGSISGAANVYAPELVEIVASLDSGNHGAASETFERLLPKLRELRQQVQPASNKARLFAEGVLASPAVRPPLTTAG